MNYPPGFEWLARLQVPVDECDTTDRITLEDREP